MLKNFRIWQILSSVLAAMFGVQSQKNLDRDVAANQPWWIYLLTALGLTAIFVYGLVKLVNFILAQAQINS